MGIYRRIMGDRLTYNVTQSALDTLASKIARNKPKPYFLSDGGDYKARPQAKSRNQFLSGLFFEDHTYQIARDVLKDSLIFGDGFLHVFERDGRVAHERVPPVEIWCDELEAELAEPRQLHRVKDIDRGALQEAFPDKAAIIKDANKVDAYGSASSAQTTASWRPLTPGARSWCQSDERPPRRRCAAGLPAGSTGPTCSKECSPLKHSSAPPAAASAACFRSSRKGRSPGRLSPTLASPPKCHGQLPPGRNSPRFWDTGPPDVEPPTDSVDWDQRCPDADAFAFA